MKFNKYQVKAIKQKTIALAMRAAAGSGKSASIIRRTSYIINKKYVSPNKILLSTFTNDATEVLKKRLKDQLGTKTASLVTVKTLHSVFYALYREVVSRYTPNSSFIKPMNGGEQIYFFKKLIQSGKFRHLKNPLEV